MLIARDCMTWPAGRQISCWVMVTPAGSIKPSQCVLTGASVCGEPIMVVEADGHLRLHAMHAPRSRVKAQARPLAMR